MFLGFFLVFLGIAEDFALAGGDGFLEQDALFLKALGLGQGTLSAKVGFLDLLIFAFEFQVLRQQERLEVLLIADAALFELQALVPFRLGLILGQAGGLDPGGPAGAERFDVVGARL